MRKLYLLTVLLFSILVKAQNYGTDVEGYSTIYTPGISLGLNVINGQLEFNYFDKSKPFKVTRHNKTKKKSEFYGIKIGGEANDGISNIFSSGKLNGGVNLDAVFGYKIFRDKEINKELIKKKENERDALVNKKQPFSEKFSDIVKEIKSKSIKKLIDDLNIIYGDITAIAVARIKNKIDANKWKEVRNDLKALNNNTSKRTIIELDFFDSFTEIREGKQPFIDIDTWKNVIIKLEKNSFVKKIEDWEFHKVALNLLDKSITEDYEVYEKLTDELSSLKHSPRNFINSKILVKFGLSKQDFKYDLDNGGLTSEERLSDEEFTGLSFDLIYNIQWRKNYFWGLSFRGERANNFSALESKEVTFGEAGTENSETLNAFAGPYDTFNRYSLNSDFMWVNRIQSQGDDYIYLLVNPYIRHFIYDNADQLKNNTNIGLGLNLFNSSKGKILGGVFIQANDVFGVNTRQSLGKSIAFGLSIRVAFKGFNFEEKSN